MTVINPFDFFVEPYAENYPFAYAPALAQGADAFPRISRRHRSQARGVARTLPRDDPAGREHASTCWCASTRATAAGDQLPRADGTRRANARARRSANAAARCRDTGWLLVQILRHLGLAARFASGYLIQLVADVKPLDGPSGTERDFTDLHAWAEAFCPAPAGSASTRRRACWRARATFRSRAPPIRATRRR
mgnify:CR=1 FL=1